MTKKIIYLNTAIPSGYDSNRNPIYNHIKNGNKNIEFRFDVPGMEVSQGAKMKVINLTHQGSSGSTSICIFKIKDTLINNSYYYGNDGSYPSLIVANVKDNSPTVIYLGSELTLNKQSINFINLVVSDSMSDISSGIIDTLNFIIVLEIEE